jgi:hypothetical protein
MEKKANPQFMRKSVEGLSIFLFFFAFCGNLTYVASILLNPAGSASPSDAGHYLLEALPYVPFHLVFSSFSTPTSLPRPACLSSPTCLPLFPAISNILSTSLRLTPASKYLETRAIADNQIPTRIRRNPLIRHDNNDPIIHVRFSPTPPRRCRINNTSEKQAEENNYRGRAHPFKWRGTYTYEWRERGETTFTTTS